MAENRESGIFQYTDKTNLSDVEEIREEKKVQEQLLEVMHMLQQYHGIMADHEKGYVLRESVLECFYGTEYVKFDCKKDHGILKGKYPVMTTKDYLEENIHNFGSCLCPEKYYKDRLPMTRAIKENGGQAQKADCNQFPHICVPLIGQGQEWKQVRPEIVKVIEEEGKKKKITTTTGAAKVLADIDENIYSELLLEDAVLVCQYGGIISIKEVPETKLKQRQQGSRIRYLTKEYIDWLNIAEGNPSFIFHPFRVMADSDDAQAVETVTIGHGITFSKESDEGRRKILKDCFGWGEEELEDIRACLFGRKSPDSGEIKIIKDGANNEKNKYFTKYKISPEQAKEGFVCVAQTYFEQVNQAIEAYEENGDNKLPPYYSQHHLEAMFDFAFNSGLNDVEAAIVDDDRMIKHYLKKDLAGAYDAVNNFGKSENRRRINQMHLFFYGGYEFYEQNTDGFKRYRSDLGF